MTVVEPDWRTKLLGVITDPNIAFILLLVGVYGLLFEFWNPGALLPGVLGGICLLLALIALSVLPVQYGALALLLLGIALMVGEAFTPGIGVLGLGGLVAFLVGSFFLFEPEGSTIDFGVSIPIIIGAAITSAGLTFVIIGAAMKARQRKAVTGAEEMIGSRGTVVDWQTGRGNIRIHGEIWSARSDKELKSGDSVRVMRREGLTLDRRARIAEGSSHAFDIPAMTGVLIPVLVILGLLLYSFRILREYERGVVFMLGRLWRVKGPGLVIVIPFIQQMVRVDLRTRVLDVPPQDVISRDNVSVRVNAVLYFRVIDPEKGDHPGRTLQRGDQSTGADDIAFRARPARPRPDAGGTRASSTPISSRILDEQTDAWGIKVANVELKHVDLNETMVRAIAKQAEAERIRRAKVIDAEGELQAAEKLAQAGQILAEHPEAMQLRYLTGLQNIASERSSTIVFPLPMDFLSKLRSP